MLIQEPSTSARAEFHMALQEAAHAEEHDRTLRARTRIHFLTAGIHMDTNVPRNALAAILLPEQPHIATDIPKVTGHGKVKWAIVRAGAVAYLEEL